MSKQETIEVDTKKLREVAIKNNENSISKLTDAIDKISGVKIPDDFEYKTELELLPNRIAGLQDTISDINRYIDKKAGEYDALQGKTLNWAPSYQGGVISPAGYTGYSTTTPEEREEQWRRLGATIFNIFGGFSEGATEMFIDGGTKAFDLAGGVCATPAWALIDIVKNGVTGGKANSHLLSDNWSDLMDRLASPGDLELQHQSEHEREESKRIDELAYGPFKYGGEGYKAIKGAGSVMGMIFGPGVAAGGATGATAGTSKVVSAISTFFTSTSRGATEYFTDKKNNSMDGIEEAYKSGDITKEEYETIKSIRNMSDEDWTKYENQVKNLSPQDPKYKDYTNIKKIREMPEEWKTQPNAVKGLTYGVGAGAWETGQYLLGLKMMNTNMSPSVRTLTNTVLNGLDPVVRAGSQATLDGTSFAENFEKQGGWGAVGRGIVIGGGLSALGEVVNYSSRRKATNSTTKTDIYLVQTDDGKVIGLLEEPPNASRCIKTYVEHPSDITVQEALNTGNYSLEQDLIDIANYNRQNRNYTSVIQDDVPGDIIDVDYDLSTNTYKAKSEIKYPLLTTNNNNSQTYPVSLYNDDLNLRIGINKPNPSNYYPSNLYFPDTRLNPYNGLKIPETGAHIANSTTVTAPIALSTTKSTSTTLATKEGNKVSTSTPATIKNPTKNISTNKQETNKDTSTHDSSKKLNNSTTLQNSQKVENVKKKDKTSLDGLKTKNDKYKTDLDNSKDQQIKYWDGYIPKEEIENSFENNVYILNDKEYEKLGMPKYNPGFCTPDGDKIIKGSAIENYPNIINHEDNHGYGSLLRDNSVPNAINKDRGFNEGATELFSLESKGENYYDGPTEYAPLVRSLRTFKSAVNKVIQEIPGYENMDLLKLSYVDKTAVEDSDGDIITTKELFDNALDEIMEQPGYTEEIRQLMNIADGGYYQDVSNTKKELARQLLWRKSVEVNKKVFGEAGKTEELTPDMLPDVFKDSIGQVTSSTTYNDDVMASIVNPIQAKSSVKDGNAFFKPAGPLDNIPVKPVKSPNANNQPPQNIGSPYNSGVGNINNVGFKTVDWAIIETLKQQGLPITKENIDKLRSEVKKGNIDVITETSGAKAWIEQYYKTEIKTIDDAIDFTIKSRSINVSYSEQRKVIIQAINNGHLNYITADNGAREVVRNIMYQNQKKYFSYKDYDEIMKQLESLDEISSSTINKILYDVWKYIDNGSIDGDESFYDYMLHNTNPSTQNQLKKIAKYDTFLKRLSLKEAQSIYAYTAGSTTIQAFVGSHGTFIGNDGMPICDEYGHKLPIKGSTPHLATIPQIINTVKAIDSGLNKGKILKVNEKFYSGLEIEKLQQWGIIKTTNLSELNSIIGKVFTIQNYISSGLSLDTSASYHRIILEIKCDAGKNYGAYVNEISNFHKAFNEMEYLIKRGAELRVDNVYNKNGKTYIEGTIIGFDPENLY